MRNPFLTKLSHGALLSDRDRARIEYLLSRPRTLDARDTIISQGDRPDDVHVVLEGFAVRYKTLPNGDRPIVAILVPGDFCGLHVAILGEMDHSIATLTACTIVDIPCETIEDLTAHHPAIARALVWSALADEAILREWLVNMGQRTADRRMAHLFCELLVRLQTVEIADDNSFELPLTQEELGTMLGMSTVHVNRVLQQLRADGLITLKGKMLAIPDVPSLKAFAGFDPSYLHLTRRARRTATDQEGLGPST